MSLRFVLFSTIIAVIAAVSSGGAFATEHVVKMLNDNGKGEFMVFEPSFVKAEPGDTVKFVAVDQFHNAQTLPEIWPDGAPTFQGELSKDVTLKIEKPGVYGVKCMPHYTLGMLALIVAGDPANADQLAAYEPPTPQAEKRFEALAAQVE